MTLAFAMSLELATAGLVEVNVQGAVLQQERIMAFYVNEGPRITRALQQLVTGGSDVTVCDTMGGGGATTGDALKVSTINPSTRQKTDTWVGYNSQYQALEYRNASGNSWYLGSHIASAQFTMNPDGTVTVYIQQTSLAGSTNTGAGIESVLERR